MRGLPSDFLAIARLDLAEVVRSRWLATCLAVYASLAAVFVGVGLRESSVVGFTGMGRVVFSLCHALVLFLPLIALAVTGQVVSRAREEGALELLLAQPIRRGSYFAAVSAVRLGAITLPLVALLFALAFGSVLTGHPVPLVLAARAAAVCTALLVAFAGLGIALSATVRNPARAMTYLIVCWAAAVALLDFGLIGLLLRSPLDPRTVFLLAAANPVQDARLALLAAVEPELTTLGPVGFWIAHRFGRTALLVLGLGWPVAFGALLWGAACQRFRRGDAL
jgi:ABC-2 type transport system permease protein